MKTYLPGRMASHENNAKRYPVPNWTRLNDEAQYDPSVQMIPEYGDVMPMADFVDCVSTSMFTRDDGTGHYSRDGVTMENDSVDLDHLDPSYPFVVWFNK